MMMFKEIKPDEFYNLKESQEEYELHWTCLHQIFSKQISTNLIENQTETQLKWKNLTNRLDNIMITFCQMHMYIEGQSFDPSYKMNENEIKKKIESKGGAYESVTFKAILDSINKAFLSESCKEEVQKLTDAIYENYSLTKIALLRMISDVPQNADTLPKIKRCHSF